MALTDYSHVRTALFVKMQVDEYLQGDGSLAPETLLFSDHHIDYELFAGETYTALGKLMSVTSSVNEINQSSNTVTIILSGIPNSSIEEIVKSKIKSSQISVYRAFFTQGGVLINDGSTTNPVGRFEGYINNYALEENWDVEQRLSTNTIVLECGSTVELFAKKQSGRQTNPSSMKKYYPNDVSFDRLPALVRANINWGGSR